MSEELIKKDISFEQWREYDFQDRIYRIDNPKLLFYRIGGTTHRVVTENNIAHCIPAPGHLGCVLRWLDKEITNPVKF